MLSCALLTNESEIEALSADWRALHARLGQIPFTDFDWTMEWWRIVGKPSGASLAVATARNSETGALVGLLPLTIRRVRGVRVMHLAAHEVFYYRAFLIDGREAAAALWRCALSENICDVAYIKNVHEEDTGSVAALDALPCAKRLETKPILHACVAGKTREALMAGCHKSFRTRVKKIARTLEADPTLCLSVSTDLAPEEVLAFIVFHKTAWAKARCKRGFFSSPQALPFLRALTNRAAAEGRFTLFRLQKHEKNLAALICLTVGRKLYCHIHAYDPAAAALSPGHLLHAETMVWAAENGFEEVNLMEGDEAYKRFFARCERPASEYVCAVTLAGRAHLCLYRLVTVLRGVRKRFPLCRVGQRHARMPTD